MKWSGLVLAVVLVCPINAPGQVDQFKKAEAAFQFQDFKTAKRLLEHLLYPRPRIRDRSRLLKAHEYLGACYFWLKQPKKMEDEFTALLVMDPEYRLDPFYYPPPLIERFEDIRKRLQRLGVIRPTKKKTPKKKKKKQRQCKTTIIKEVHRSKVVAFIPFGVGQFYNHETGKGIAFAVTQGVGLATNMGAFIGIVALGRSDGTFSPSQAKVARILRYVQYAGLGVFVVSAVWGIIDAVTHFKEKTRTRKVLIGPCGVGSKIEF